MRTLLAFFFLLSVTAFAQKESPAPDTIFVNGNIYTGTHVETCGGKPCWEGIVRAQAMAVKGGRIIAVGSDDKIKALKGRDTKVVDLGGRFVMPGFNDAHLHFAAGGLEKTRVNLIGVKSLAEMKARIAEAVKHLQPGEWIGGRGWDETLWAARKLPTRFDIDDITDGHPAFFSRVDGHAALVNSAALKARGITRQTPDPPGGSYTRDAAGELTGIVREAAWDQFYEAMPKPSLAQRRRGIELAMQEAREWGLTSVQDSMTTENDPTEWDDFLLYEDLEREGKLTVRITRWLSFHEPLDLLVKHRAHHPQDDPMLHTGMIGEVYLDGSLGSRSAALLQPYSDDPGNSGIVRMDQGTMNDKGAELALQGFQVGFHAIGDRAAQMALDAIAYAELRYNWRNQNSPERRRANQLRFRIEHDQVIGLDQIHRFAELGVIASIQPSHLLTDMHWAESRLGPERARNSYPWRSFLSQGVRLAFGTDFAVEPMDPFRGLYAAVTRMSEDGKQGYYPEQKLTIDEAIEAYTAGSAYAEFAERDKGRLSNGMLADFIVLDRDISRVAPQELLKARVLETWLGGRQVFLRQ
jgi:predicted amidohydrolase YtcJ